MILVTGADSAVGKEVVRQLVSKGEKVRAFVRSGRPDLGGVEIVNGDLGDVKAIEGALRGVDRVYALSGGPDLATHDRNIVEAARRTNVRKIVKHSVLGAEWESIAITKWHREGERIVEGSGLAWAHVRPSGFMSNAFTWVTTVKSAGAVYFPAGDGKMGVVDPKDIAAVAVSVLTSDAHDGKAHAVTGPEALSLAEQVQKLSSAIDRKIDYVDVPEDAARASMSQFMPAVMVDAMIEFTRVIKAGQAALLTETVQRITGKAPRTFDQWLRDNAAAFR